MTVVFVVCAVAGTTVLVLQFLLGLIGLGGDSLGVDAPHDFGSDLGGTDHDLGGVDHDLAGGDAAHGGLSAEHAEDHAPTQTSAAAQAARLDVVLPSPLVANDHCRTGVLRPDRHGRPGRRVGAAGDVAGRHRGRRRRHVRRLRHA